jgi:CRP/FNR family transcriptional regulator
MSSQAPSYSTLLNSLASISFLQGVEKPILEKVAGAARWQVHPAGSTVFWEGDRAPGFYYLHTGWLKVVKSSPDGREQVLRFLGPGETFNEMGIFTNRPNPATAVALEDAGVWLIERGVMRQLLLSHPDVALQVLENLAGRVVDLVTLVADLSLHSVEARLARFLLEQAEDDQVRRRRWTTQSELAARLGTVPDVLSRALRSLSDAGMIQVDRQRIRILDLPALRQRAQVDV